MNNKILLWQIPLGLGFGLFLLLALSTVAGAQDNSRPMPTEVPHTRNAQTLTGAPNDCDSKRDLAGNINGGSGTIQNYSTTCAYVVGMASYRKFDEIYDNQILFDSALAQIQPGQTLTLNVGVPECAAQIDLFFGPPLPDLKGKRYGDRLVAWLHTSRPYCVMNAPQPTATTVAPATPPATTAAPPPATTAAPATPAETTVVPPTTPAATTAAPAPTTPAPATTSAPANTPPATSAAPTAPANTPVATSAAPTAPPNTPVATSAPTKKPVVNVPVATIAPNTPVATSGTNVSPPQPENTASAEETAVASVAEGSAVPSKKTAVLNVAMPSTGTGGTSSSNGSFTLWLVVGLFLMLTVATGSLLVLKKRA